MTNPLDYTIQDHDAMRYALMQDSSYRGGGAVHMEDGGFLNSVYRNVVPAHLRTFGETLMGDRTPITEKNFTPSELDQMRNAIMSSRKDREAMNQRMFANTIDKEFKSGASDKELMAIMKQGPSQKIDQSVGYQHYPGGDVEVRRDTDFGHDASIRSTLGRFAYNKDANGNLIATDNYKFTNDLPDQTRPTSDYAGMSTPEKLWLLAKDTAQMGGLETLPSRVGNAFIGADGRPVSVNLGAAPFAHGGAVHMEDGGEVNQSELDRMRFEIAQAQNPTSPVMQATPRSPVQDFIGTMGGYMDKAGKFVSEAIEPLAESHPRQHFIANMLVADPLKGAGTALQDYTGTVRETDEDNPVRGVIDKNWKNLTNGTQPLLDPRVLDVAQFAQPVVKGLTKLAGAGAKAIAPFASSVDDMVRELHASGAIPQPGLSIKDVTPKALAPANEQGFYSPTEAAALNLQRKTGNGQAFLNDLLKQENVRPDEIKAMGLDTFLKGRTSVTAAEVQDYIAQNKLGLGEARYGALTKDISESRDAFKAYGQELANKYGIPEGQNISMYAGLKNIPAEEIAKYERLQNEWLDQQPKAAKFSGYQLPGGENYREVVLTLPDNKLPAPKQMDRPKVVDSGVDESGRGQFDVVVDGKPVERFNTWSQAQDHALELEQSENIKRNLEWQKNQKNQPENYRSSHFDEPNVLAHLRMSDRVTDGKKTLLVDEVQSDWHQAGRERGYRTPEAIAKQAEINQQLKRLDLDRLDLYDELKAIQLHDPNYPFNNDWLEANKKISENTKQQSDLKEQALSFGSIPDAPYKEDWYQLALRRAVKEAIDGGYDRVALPTGARVAERFDLSKQADGVFWNPDKKELTVKTKDGDYAPVAVGISDQEVSKYVGKDVAKRLLSTDKENVYGVGNVHSLLGEDLTVGGEGMKKYYDEIYPGYLKKFGKKYGASIGKTTVDVEGAPEPLHYMDITPAMREAFKIGIHMKKGGKVSFADSLDAMRHELTKAK